MDPNTNNPSQIDDLDESDFSVVSSDDSTEMDLKQILEKVQKLEAELAKNEQQANQSGGSSSILQIGEKFGKIENQMEVMKEKMEGLRSENAGLKGTKKEEKCAFEELKKEMEKMGQENRELKKEFGKKNAEMVKMEKEFAGKYAALEGKIDQKDRQIQEMNEENGKLGRELEILKEEMGKRMAEMKVEIGAKNGEFEGQIGGMKEKVESLDGKMREMEEQKAEKKELANLEARTVDVIKIDGNKWAQCGPKIAISDGELVVKHSETSSSWFYESSGWNSVRAEMAFPKFNLNPHKSISYFEVEIMANPKSGCIFIGFCTQQFPLEDNWLGGVQNSIGICYKEGIYIDGKGSNFGNGGDYFQVGEVIGIGILHFPANSTMKCFASCNGNLLGMVDLCPKFASLELFPAISMFYGGDSIRAKFAAKQWKYNPLELVQNMR